MLHVAPHTFSFKRKYFVFMRKDILLLCDDRRDRHEQEYNYVGR